MNVSYSVMPGSRMAGQYKEHAETLYNYCCQNVNEFLSLSDNDSFHVGMAFNIIVSNMEETQNRMSPEATKFKFSLYASLLCLFKALQMGTMQSKPFWVLKRIKRSAVAAALPITFNRNDYLPESF